MISLHVSPNRDGYKLVENAIRPIIDFEAGNRYLVQLKMKSSLMSSTNWIDITELLSVDYDSEFKELQLFWDTDWYDGQEEIIILAVANIRDIDISESFPVEH